MIKRGFLKFNTDLRERTPYHTTFSSNMRRVKRQLKGVWNACSANKSEAGAQRGEIANHAFMVRLVHGNFGAPVHLGAVSSSPLSHALILDKKHCLRINGNVLKMLIIGNQTVGES
jgi:hypothetical protein